MSDSGISGASVQKRKDSIDRSTDAPVRMYFRNMGIAILYNDLILSIKNQ
ncbi:hypothetical protein [Candidatus Liberibacter sp.]|nr:hypothetical protein [Candidatus Liberibacter sp.]MBA5723532.1 hypothetical protein [Candidatus Liberibacter sp.]